jgi:hypothetical protein
MRHWITSFRLFRSMKGRWRWAKLQRPTHRFPVIFDLREPQWTLLSSFSQASCAWRSVMSARASSSPRSSRSPRRANSRNHTARRRSICTSLICDALMTGTSKIGDSVACVSNAVLQRARARLETGASALRAIRNGIALADRNRPAAVRTAEFAVFSGNFACFCAHFNILVDSR